MSKFKKEIVDNKFVVSFVIEKDELSKAVEAERKIALKNVTVKGFRKGKAPEAEAMKVVNMLSVAERAYNKVVSKIAPEAKKEALDYVTKEKIQAALGLESYNSKEEENGDLRVEISYPIIPSLENSKYKVENEKFELSIPTDDEVLNDALAEVFGPGQYVKVDDKSKEGDQLVFNFKGFVDGEAFEGGEAKDFKLVLGSKQFIPGFEDQLIGKKAGFKGMITVTFPNDYHVSDLKGKPAEFEIEILEVQRFERVTSESELAKGVFGENDTLKELMILQKKPLFLIKKFNEATSKFLRKVVDKIVVQLEDLYIDEAFLGTSIKEQENEFNKLIKEYGVKKTEYLNAIKATEEDLRKEFVKKAREDVLASLIYNDLIKRYVSKELKEEDKKDILEFANAGLKTTKELKDEEISSFLIIDKLLEAQKNKNALKELKAYREYCKKEIPNILSKYEELMKKENLEKEQNMSESSVKVEEVKENK